MSLCQPRCFFSCFCESCVYKADICAPAFNNVVISSCNKVRRSCERASPVPPILEHPSKAKTSSWVSGWMASGQKLQGQAAQLYAKKRASVSTCRQGPFKRRFRLVLQKRATLCSHFTKFPSFRQLPVWMNYLCTIVMEQSGVQKVETLIMINVLDH